MEVKVTCNCGTKYKFDVEPVHGRMPMQVNCPSCGDDGTAQANEILRQAFSTRPASSPPAGTIPVAVAVPRTVPAAALPLPTTAAAPLLSSTPPPIPVIPARPQAAPPPSAPPSPGLGPIPTAPPIGYAMTASAPSPHAPAQPPPPPMPAAPVAPFPVAAPPAKPKSALPKVLTIVLIVLCLGFGIWRLGSRWAKRFKAVADIASAIGEASHQAAKGEPKNLTEDDCVILFIRHTNHVDVAEACKVYWKEKLHKTLTVTESLDTAEQEGEYSVLPEHNGYVRLISTRDWPPEQFEGVAKDLSQKLDTMVLEMTSEHVADTYHFGAYEQGARKFHAQMDVKMGKDDFDEIVTTEGDDWAIAHGYKPGPDGFKSFDLADADKITQSVGLKLWDEKEGVELKGLLMKEAAGTGKK